MASAVQIISIAMLIQTITCQGIGTALNAGLKNAPFGNNYPNALVNPGLGNPGLGGPGLKGPGLVGCGSTGKGLLGPGVGTQGLSGCGRANGGSFAVTSTSSITPTGVSILAENLAIEGPLSVGGLLPFLGTVGVEGSLPARGSGTVSYGCGNGNVGVTSDFGANGVAAQYSVTSNFGPVATQYGPNLAGLRGMSGSNLAGYNSGLANAGLNAPGLLGPGFVGNGLIGGVSNLARPGLNDAVLK